MFLNLQIRVLFAKNSKKTANILNENIIQLKIVYDYSKNIFNKIKKTFKLKKK